MYSLCIAGTATTQLSFWMSWHDAAQTNHHLTKSVWCNREKSHLVKWISGAQKHSWQLLSFAVWFSHVRVIVVALFYTLNLKFTSGKRKNEIENSRFFFDMENTLHKIIEMKLANVGIKRHAVRKKMKNVNGKNEVQSKTKLYK